MKTLPEKNRCPVVKYKILLKNLYVSFSPYLCLVNFREMSLQPYETSKILLVQAPLDNSCPCGNSKLDLFNGFPSKSLPPLTKVKGSFWIMRNLTIKKWCFVEPSYKKWQLGLPGFYDTPRHRLGGKKNPKAPMDHIGQMISRPNVRVSKSFKCVFIRNGLPKNGRRRICGS